MKTVGSVLLMVVLSSISVAYFVEAWEVAQTNRRFERSPLREATVKLSGMRELSTLESGGPRLPFTGRPSHFAYVDYPGGTGPAAVPDSVVADLAAGKAIQVEYRQDLSIDFRFKGSGRSPWPMVLLGGALAVLATLVGLGQAKQHCGGDHVA